MIFRSRRRQRDAFHAEALVHLDALYNSARYMTRDERDAEDLVQETLLKAYRFFDRYQRGTNCKAWLFRIMTNTHINRQRGKAKQFTFIDNVDVDGGVDATPINEASAFYKDPEHSYLHGLVHDQVKAALDSLPDDYRTTVVLADLQDFAYKEIAEIMDCPIGTVMSRLHRGRKMLQKKLYAHAVETGVLEAGPLDGSSESKEARGQRAVTDLDAYRRSKRTASA